MARTTLANVENKYPQLEKRARKITTINLPEDGTITQLLFPISESHFNEEASPGYYYYYDTNQPVPESFLTQYNLN
jgi:hypothetical protein